MKDRFNDIKDIDNMKIKEINQMVKENFEVW